MKTTSKKLYLGVALSLAIIMVVSGNTKSMAVATSSVDVCAHIETLSSTNSANIATHIASMETDFASRMANIASRQAGVDQQSATFRASIASKFDLRIANLKKQTGLTAEQSAAIDTYATDMRAAEATREVAVDAARATYRTALSSAINAHQQTLKDAATTFETAVSTAFTTAQANCSAGKTAVDTLKTSISTARQALTLTRQSNTISSNIQQLVITRNAAVKAADEAFGVSSKAYTATLKALFAS